MKNIIIIKIIVILIISSPVLNNNSLKQIAFAQEYANIEYYRSNIKALLKFETPPKKLKYFLPLKGTTDLKTLVIEIKKINSNKSVRRVFINLDKSDSFNKAYLFKDDPGKYQIIILGDKRPNSNHFAGICVFNVIVTESIPNNYSGFYINNKIIDYVNLNMGKTVARGECWDLAQRALDKNGADWKRLTHFGRLLDPKKDEIKPGDIIQFKSLKTMTVTKDGRKIWNILGFPDHTSVIHKVIDKLHYNLAHQNVKGKRFVIITELDLNKVVSGRYWIYRPVAGLVAPKELP